MKRLLKATMFWTLILVGISGSAYCVDMTAGEPSVTDEFDVSIMNSTMFGGHMMLACEAVRPMDRGLDLVGHYKGNTCLLDLGGSWHECGLYLAAAETTATIRATSKQDVDVVFHCKAGLKGTGVFDGAWVSHTIRAVHNCGANVYDVTFPDIQAGSSETEGMRIYTTGTGRSTITIKSTDMTDTGSLQLGGNPDIIVRPTDSAHIHNNAWITNGEMNLALQTGNSVRGDKYTSNLTATLTCE